MCHTGRPDIPPSPYAPIFHIHIHVQDRQASFLIPGLTASTLRIRSRSARAPMTNISVVRVRSAKPNAINSRKNRAPPARAIFRDGKVSH